MEKKEVINYYFYYNYIIIGDFYLYYFTKNFEKFSGILEFIIARITLKFIITYYYISIPFFLGKFSIEFLRKKSII